MNPTPLGADETSLPHPPPAGSSPSRHDPQPNKGLNFPAEQPMSPSGNDALSPEEQMARFEDDLKENDWGHQPC
jgi:hypothetical protein